MIINFPKIKGIIDTALYCEDSGEFEFIMKKTNNRLKFVDNETAEEYRDYLIDQLTIIHKYLDIQE